LNESSGALRYSRHRDKATGDNNQAKKGDKEQQSPFTGSAQPTVVRLRAAKMISAPARDVGINTSEGNLAHVVVQAPHLPDHVLEKFVALIRPEGSITRLPLANGDAFRLHDVGYITEAQQAQLEALGERHGVDTAIISGDRDLSRLGLVATDMDSTLILGECIDAMAAKWQEILDERGVKGRNIASEVEEITKRAMNGEIDFAESLVERVALLEGFPVEALQNVLENHVELSPGARETLALCGNLGAERGILSGGFTYFTEPLKNELDLEFDGANELEIGPDNCLTGKLVGNVFDPQAKADQVTGRRQEDKISLALGDGANDVWMLSEADVAVAYRAKPGVAAAARARKDETGRPGEVHTIRRTDWHAVPNLFMYRPRN
jgi:phosphoserine phosphatase